MFALLGAWPVPVEQLRNGSGDSLGGEQMWRPGAGGLSLIEAEQLPDANGETFGLSITWWNADAKTYRALGCRSLADSGCVPVSKSARREEEQFVLAGDTRRAARLIAGG